MDLHEDTLLDYMDDDNPSSSGFKPYTPHPTGVAQKGPTGVTDAGSTGASTTDDRITRLESSFSSVAKALKDMGDAWKTIADQKRSAADRSSGSPQGKRRKVTSHQMSDSNDDDDDNHDADVDALMSGSQQGHPSTMPAQENDSDSESEFLDEIMTEMTEQEPTGPEVSEKLSKIVENRMRKSMGKDVLIEKEKHYPVPKNCQALATPILNEEIRSKVNAGAKSRDIRLFYIQKAVLKAATAVTQITDSLVKDKGNRSLDQKDILRKATDALALLGHASQELSARRKEAIRPDLKPKYWSLCQPETTPVTSKLFGDDISKAVKDARQADEVTKEFSKNWKRGQKNFNPRINYRRGNFQSRPYGRGGYQSRGGKQPYYKKKPQEK